eukprot:CAMPEP_0118698066 /NCGR_PEP_ID=MMETSP0800-20121206/14957_1 /TAXON_ID=210618 ORGANISM="Striatella unipunctata, Strain CCMP2910" /NCGR_SAMPLE_ID=MMETSP0800 /ASSEMBLY_ACC=CAM_ASM_000638 /LENGTH=211 /DNA_ID=CAMNT_0006597771 /DNA_START=40 /DNA_END=672 /DNA_ORIENTATION=+
MTTTMLLPKSKRISPLQQESTNSKSGNDSSNNSGADENYRSQAKTPQLRRSFSFPRKFFASLEDELVDSSSNEHGIPVVVSDSDNDDDSSVGSFVSATTIEEDDIHVAKRKKKQVWFSTCSVQEYTSVIGDHPCCKEGIPISLGWEHSTEQVYKVYLYEIRQRTTQHNLYMMLDPTERRERLMQVSGYSQEELDQVEETIAHEKEENPFFW